MKKGQYRRDYVSVFPLFASEFRKAQLVSSSSEGHMQVMSLSLACTSLGHQWAGLQQPHAKDDLDGVSERFQKSMAELRRGT